MRDEVSLIKPPSLFRDSLNEMIGTMAQMGPSEEELEEETPEKGKGRSSIHVHAEGKQKLP